VHFRRTNAYKDRQQLELHLIIELVPRNKNTFLFGYKNQLILYTEIIGVYSGIQTKTHTCVLLIECGMF